MTKDPQKLLVSQVSAWLFKQRRDLSFVALECWIGDYECLVCSIITYPDVFLLEIIRTTNIQCSTITYPDIFLLEIITTTNTPFTTSCSTVQTSVDASRHLDSWSRSYSPSTSAGEDSTRKRISCSDNSSRSTKAFSHLYIWLRVTGGISIPASAAASEHSSSYLLHHLLHFGLWRTQRRRAGFIEVTMAR